MKKILLAFSCLLLILQLHAQTELLTLAENKLHGPVHSVTTSNYFLVEKFGEWEMGSSDWKETAEFNKKGLLIFSSKYLSKFVITNHFSYNKKNQLTQWKHVLAEKKVKDKVSVKKYDYDDEGREIVLDFYGDDDELTWKDKKNYNEDGLLKEVFNYNRSGALAVHSVYIYDDSKRLQSLTVKDAKKEIVKTYEYEYDAAGNKTGEATFEKFGNVRKNFVWVYQNGLKVSETKTTTTSKRKTIEQREYNKAGDEISYSNMVDFNTKTVYTYDSHNNWVTATVTYKNFDKKNAGHRMVREIKYY